MHFTSGPEGIRQLVFLSKLLARSRIYRGESLGRAGIQANHHINCGCHPWLTLESIFHTGRVVVSLESWTIFLPSIDLYPGDQVPLRALALLGLPARTSEDRKSLLQRSATYLTTFWFSSRSINAWHRLGALESARLPLPRHTLGHVLLSRPGRLRSPATPWRGLWPPSTVLLTTTVSPSGLWRRLSTARLRGTRQLQRPPSSGSTVWV